MLVEVEECALNGRSYPSSVKKMSWRWSSHDGDREVDSNTQVRIAGKSDKKGRARIKPVSFQLSIL